MTDMKTRLDQCPGTVYWITGLSGSGKTTLANALYGRLSAVKNNVVLLDGDKMREAFGDDLGYTPEARLKCAERYSKLCCMICTQGVDVVCSTISLFQQIHAWNRKHIKHYVEIYLSLPDGMKSERNDKGLYSEQSNSQTKSQAVLINDIYQAPKNPDMLIECEDRQSPETLAQKIFNQYAKTVS